MTPESISAPSQQRDCPSLHLSLLRPLHPNLNHLRPPLSHSHPVHHHHVHPYSLHHHSQLLLLVSPRVQSTSLSYLNPVMTLLFLTTPGLARKPGGMMQCASWSTRALFCGSSLAAPICAGSSETPLPCCLSSCLTQSRRSTRLNTKLNPQNYYDLKGNFLRQPYPCATPISGAPKFSPRHFLMCWVSWACQTPLVISRLAAMFNWRILSRASRSCLTIITRL